jgi:hypothetical protein
MKQLSLILCCVLLLSCVGSTADADLAKAFGSKHIYSNLNFSCFAPAASASYKSVFDIAGGIKPVVPDTSINNKLFINNGGSVYGEFGIIDSLLHDREGGFSEMYVKNRSGSQYLRMIQHLGCGWNAIGEFEFGYTTDLPDSIPTIPSDMLVFATESGIHLGMPQAEVIKIKGQGYTRTMINKKETSISYVIKYWDKDEARFLSRYKMEMYYVQYTFKEDKVKKVKFGFDYL